MAVSEDDGEGWVSRWEGRPARLPRVTCVIRMFLKVPLNPGVLVISADSGAPGSQNL